MSSEPASDGALLLYGDRDLAPLGAVILPNLVADGAGRPVMGHYVIVKLRSRTSGHPDYHLMVLPAQGF